jgi:cobalt-zinc-cadmium efflux system membrane fusion protein
LRGTEYSYCHKEKAVNSKHDENESKDTHKHGTKKEHNDQKDPVEDEHTGHDHGAKDDQAKKSGRDDHGDHDDHGEEGVIKMSEESQKLGNISVMPIEYAPIVQKVFVNGRIAQDVEKVTHIHPEKSGRIQKCLATLGTIVAQGDVICVITGNNNELIKVTSPVAGTVIAEFVKAGDQVNTTNALYTIADMTHLAANFDVYEKDLANVKVGQKINVYPMTYNDRAFEAEIIFVSPRVDESTYTTRIKALVDNPVGLLKLGMSVRGEIEVSDDSSYLKVPSDAVKNVEGKDLVFVQTDKETFEKREVTLKSRTSKEAAIIGDLKKGDRVVIKGAFILKSKLLESEMEHAHDH